MDFKFLKFRKRNFKSAKQVFDILKICFNCGRDISNSCYKELPNDMSRFNEDKWLTDCYHPEISFNSWYTECDCGCEYEIIPTKVKLIIKKE